MKEALVNCGALHLGQVLTIATEFCSGPQHSALQSLCQAPCSWRGRGLMQSDLSH